MFRKLLEIFPVGKQALLGKVGISMVVGSLRNIQLRVMQLGNK